MYWIKRVAYIVKCLRRASHSLIIYVCIQETHTYIYIYIYMCVCVLTNSSTKGKVITYLSQEVGAGRTANNGWNRENGIVSNTWNHVLDTIPFQPLGARPSQLRCDQPPVRSIVPILFK
jgi:hypothetical protein